MSTHLSSLARLGSVLVVLSFLLVSGCVPSEPAADAATGDDGPQAAQQAPEAASPYQLEKPAPKPDLKAEREILAQRSVAIDESPRQAPAAKTTPAAAPRQARAEIDTKALAKATADAKGGPRIACDEPVYDYGRRDNQEMVEHDWVLKSVGDAELRITGKPKTSCGCTVAELTKTVIPPGEEAILRASLNLKGKEGKRSTTISVPTNDPTQPNFILTFTGTAVAAVRMTPNSVSFGRVPAGELADDMKFTMTAVAPDVSFNITKVTVDNPNFEAAAATVTEGKVHEITVRNVTPVEKGPITGTVTVYTDDPERPVYPVRIYGSAVGSITVSPERINVYYNPESDKPTSQYLRVAAGRVKEFQVLEVIPPAEGVEVSFSPRKAQFSEYLIKLTNMPTDGSLDGKEVIIRTDVPDMEEIRVPIYNRKTNAAARAALQQRLPMAPAAGTGPKK